MVVQHFHELRTSKTSLTFMNTFFALITFIIQFFTVQNTNPTSVSAFKSIERHLFIIWGGL